MLVAASVGAGVLFNRLLWDLMESGWTVRRWVVRYLPLLATLVAALLLTASVSGVILSLAVLEVVLSVLALLDLAKDWLMKRILLAGRR